jgi:hypothetical protein
MLMPISVIFVSTTLYTSIRLRNRIHPLAVVGFLEMALMVVAMFKTGLDCLCRVSMGSMFYVAIGDPSRSRTAASVLPGVKMSPLDKRHFRGIRPLTFLADIGSIICFTVGKGVFVRLIHEIIIANLISLSVAF